MARTVADAALLLDVLAGADGLDPRQCPRPPAVHGAALTGDASGLRVGVLAEGFGHHTSDPRVDALVREQAGRLAAAGATVVDVSVPAHRMASGLLGAILGHGLVVGTFAGGVLGTLGSGRYSPSLAAHWAGGLGSAELSPNALVLALAGQLVLQADHGVSYARARNAVPGIVEAYAAAFADVDLMVLPTLGFIAGKLPAADADPVTSVIAAFSSGPNAAPFDVTGHPAQRPLRHGRRHAGRDDAGRTALRGCHRPSRRPRLRAAVTHPARTYCTPRRSAVEAAR